MIGAAQACFAQLLDYSKTRIPFGRPLAQNQTIQIRLAHMARHVTAARLIALELNRLKDQGGIQPSLVSFATWNNCRMALEVSRDCRNMLGGVGSTAQPSPLTGQRYETYAYPTCFTASLLSRSTMAPCLRSSPWT